ncbi:GntR family transcriptional regulator, histidine utilization repressor [Ensifer adhaerens]|nr:GntR family transcriptional regulator, histidine utilization repressor [Ensifer adhaerens]HZG28614.1 histidine utilization repressor [Ensifer sp.]
MSASKDATLHQRILSDIESHILSGEWAPGYRIPFEVELAAQYQCSRMTVNKVMTQLAKKGVIERRKKGGSFVTQPHSQAAVLEINDIEAEVLALNLPYRCEVRAHAARKARAEDVRRMEVPPGAAILDVRCLHYAGPRPFCLEERIINIAAVPSVVDADFATISPGRWLIQQIPWSSAEHRIYAQSASAPNAAELRINDTAACLVVERRTWLAEQAVTSVRFIYPGESHSLIARFSPAH